jgi:hypothetical protein
MKSEMLGYGGGSLFCTQVILAMLRIKFFTAWLFRDVNMALCVLNFLRIKYTGCSKLTWPDNLVA